MIPPAAKGAPEVDGPTANYTVAGPDGDGDRSIIEGPNLSTFELPRRYGDYEPLG